SKWDVSGRSRLALADDLFDLLADGFQRDVERFESLSGNALALVDQAEQNVLRADVVVIQHARFFLRENHNSPCPVGKALEHRSIPFGPGRPAASRSASRIQGPRPTL